MIDSESNTATATVKYQQNNSGIDLSLPGSSLVLRFTALNIHFCIAIQHVLRVISLVALQPVPQAHNYLKGLMNLEGDSVPVLDLAECFGLSHTQPYTLNTPIILCTDGIKRTGLIVDEVLGVADLREAELQMDEFFQDQDSPFGAIINLDGALSMLLNLRHLQVIDLERMEAVLDLVTLKKGQQSS